MNSENICFASKTIDIAEHDTYLELTNCMGYFDDENLNHVILPYEGCEEDALVMAQTLINMPVQARYKKVNGNDDLGSHEVVVAPNGEVEFLTESVGVNTDVWIEKSNVTTVNGEHKELPCLFAKKRIWKRNKNMVNAIKRLYESAKGLGSSWEIQTYEYSFKDGKKTLNNYTFLADTLLGSTVTPAYNGTSKAFALSEQDLMVAEALALDMCDAETFDINNENKEANDLEDSKTLSSEELVEEISTEEVSTEQPTTEEVSETEQLETPVENSETKDEEEEKEKEEENPSDEDPIENPEDDDEEKDKEISEVEASSMTDFDLRNKINQALDKLDNEKFPWMYLVFLFPEEHKFWARSWKLSELDYYEFTYTVNGDEVEISEPVEITLVASPKNINDTVAEFNQQISEKDDLITTVSAELTALKAEVSELNIYKEKFEASEKERIDAEITAKKEELIASVVKSGMISREEIEASEEMTQMVNELDKKSLMSIVGERLLSSVSEKEVKPEVETSTAKETVHVATNLNNDNEETLSANDKVKIMRKFLGK